MNERMRQRSGKWEQVEHSEWMNEWREERREEQNWTNGFERDLHKQNVLFHNQTKKYVTEDIL